MSQQGLLTPGTILEKKYRIAELIGEGGYSEVYRGVQENIQRSVAIKILKLGQDFERNRRHMMRFKREAILLAQLRDWHTITLFDFGVTPTGTTFIVFDYIDGESLDSILARDGAISEARVIAITRQLLRSLQEAHALGIIHRDIKPSNILLHSHLGERDCVKLLDFGIAKLFDDDSGLTARGHLIGTPHYVAPERIGERPLTPSSDFYSLGLVMLEMLTGKRAMANKNYTEVLRWHASKRPHKIPSSEVVSPALGAIVGKMIAKKPSDRWVTAAQIVHALDELNPT